MKLTETEKETLGFLLKKMETTQFDWDDSVGMRINLENEHNPGVMVRRLERLYNKGILESVRYESPLIYMSFAFKKLLLAYNGIFIDTLEDHLGEKYKLDIYPL